MGVMLIGQLILLGSGLAGAEGGRAIGILHNVLNTSSFILGNLGIYQLYGETTKRVMRTVYGLLIGAVIFSFMPLATDIYGILLVAFAFVAIKPIVDESKEYQTGLIFYGIAVVAHAAIGFTGTFAALQAIDNLCRIVFFAILFLLLFNKVLSLMVASYNKSTQDSLTGLFNRFYFYTTVSYLSCRTRRSIRARNAT